MKHLRISLKLAVLLLLTLAPLDSLRAEGPITPQARGVMHQFLGQFLELQSFMVTHQTEHTSVERQKIARDLNELVRLSKDLRKMHDFESTGFRISAQLLIDQIENASEAFSKGNFSYARRNLRATLDVCSSCHVQVSEGNIKSWRIDPDQLRGSMFQRAEFLYSTRQYSAAQKLYEDFTKNFIPEQSQMELELALSRLMSLNLRVHRDLKAAAENIKLLRNHPAYTKPTRATLQAWEKEIEALSKMKIPNPKTATASELVAFVSKNLSLDESKTFAEPSKVIRAFLFTGLLYEFIRIHPAKDLTPETLYWLALYENRLGENYPVELSQLYLKECILKFPKTSGAKSCFAEYQELKTLDYTGSAGTDLPQDVKKELELLKALL